jgi:membrane protease YdiL (CAAX protease family)
VGAVVGLVLLLHFVRPSADAEEFSLDLMTRQVQSHYGTMEIAGPLGGGEAAYEPLAKALARGPVAQRQRFAAVAGDLAGPGKALALLDETERLLRERHLPLAGKEAELEGILRRRYSGVELPEAEKAALRRELGWFGELALAPAGSPGREAVMVPARRAASRQFLVFGCCVGLLVLGVFGAVVFWLAVLRREGTFFLLGPGTAPHGIYAETFAAWMVLFVLVSVGAGFLARVEALREYALAVEGGAILLSLGALAWPVWRGVPFARVRDDLGLRLPPDPAKEVLAGFACWLTALPAMAAALLVVVVLAFLAGMAGGPEDPLAPTSLPTHPIMGELTRGGRWILVLLLASGVAPIVEETFFRGALYRHLRDATGGKGRLKSVAISAGLSGFVFAVIHPQGLLAVPLLMAVAWSLVQAREWRGSLLAPMAAHALNNAVATVFVLLTFGG